MNRKKIKPKKGKEGKRIKPPSIPVPISSPDAKPPIFSLRHLDKKFSILNCEEKEKAGFVETVCRLSTLSWRELRQAPRHGMGYEKITRNKLRASIPSHVTEEVDFIAFQFFGKAPMVGYRDGEVFHIIWFDRNFTLYDHG